MFSTGTTATIGSFIETTPSLALWQVVTCPDKRNQSEDDDGRTAAQRRGRERSDLAPGGAEGRMKRTGQSSSLLVPEGHDGGNPEPAVVIAQSSRANQRAHGNGRSVSGNTERECEFRNRRALWALVYEIGQNG
jgi:hypothetical protein